MNDFFQSLLAIVLLIFIHPSSVERAYAQKTENLNFFGFESAYACAENRLDMITLENSRLCSYSFSYR